MNVDVSPVSGAHVPRNSQRILKLFIEAYKASPELWDPNNINYTNKYRRIEAQENLLSIYKLVQEDATRIDVRKKINTLRSNYNKEMAKIKTAEAEGREYIPKNWLFHQLRFLDVARKPGCLEESENEEAGETETEASKIKVENTYTTLTNFVNVDQIQNIEVTHDQQTQPTPKAKPIKRTISQQRRLDKHLPNPHSTGIEPIALVWSSKLQNLRPSQRMLAEKAINDVLFEAYLNNLGKGPLVINTGVSSVATEVEGFAVEVPEEYIEYGTTDEEA
ncbi:uncharacterized protein [Epargyreus clarus]|uniref:uncharacterized protein n=1 Tax=Epargyreus clarus TaxID=520877 RepID=UPI003C2F4058